VLLGEGGEALARGVLVAGVAEGAENVGVLVARKAVGVGHHGVYDKTIIHSSWIA